MPFHLLQNCERNCTRLFLFAHSDILSTIFFPYSADKLIFMDYVKCAPSGFGLPMQCDQWAAPIGGLALFLPGIISNGCVPLSQVTSPIRWPSPTVRALAEFLQWFWRPQRPHRGASLPFVYFLNPAYTTIIIRPLLKFPSNIPSECTIFLPSSEGYRNFPSSELEPAVRSQWAQQWEVEELCAFLIIFFLYFQHFHHTCCHRLCL
jgi:hypothetical protein